VSDATPGEKLDAKLAELRTAFDELAVEIEAALGPKVDAVSAKIDEVQAAWDARE
jgi:hypothetical protein